MVGVFKLTKPKIRLLLQVSLVVVGGLIITVFASFQTYKNSDREARSDFTSVASLLFAGIESRLLNSLSETNNIVALIKADEDLTQERFFRYVEANNSLNDQRLAIVVLAQRKPADGPDVAHDKPVQPLFVWAKSQEETTRLLKTPIPQNLIGLMQSDFLQTDSDVTILPPDLLALSGGKRVLLYKTPVADLHGNSVVIYQFLSPRYFVEHVYENPVWATINTQVKVLKDGEELAGSLGIVDGKATAKFDVKGDTSFYTLTEVINFTTTQWEFTFFSGDGFKPNLMPVFWVTLVFIIITSLIITLLWTSAGRARKVMEVVERRTSALTDAHLELEEHYKLLQHLNNDLEEARRSAESANKTKSEFLATISHELRTPLNAILGFSQIIIDQSLGDIGDERYVEYARDINVSGEHLLGLINDILDLAKLESGKISIASKPVDIRSVLDRIYTIFSLNEQVKNINLVMDFDDSLPDLIMGDMLRLRQILINLVSNAVKFTKKGEVRMYMRSAPNQSGRRCWYMGVQDTGIGIPEDQVDGLFDRFTQVDNTLTRSHGGVGLGLAICKELAVLMGGKISIESVEGKGTNIWVTLPLEEAADFGDDPNDILI